MSMLMSLMLYCTISVLVQVLWSTIHAPAGARGATGPYHRPLIL